MVPLPPTVTPPYANGYTTLFTNTVVPFIEEAEIADQVYDAMPMFQLVMEAGNVERKRLGHTWLHKVNFSKGPRAQPFKYYDPVIPTTFTGSSPVKVSPANYVIPFQISWEEMQESTTEDAIADLVLEKMQLLYLGFRETVQEDMYAGNGANAKRMLGLQQLCSPADQIQLDGSGSADINDRIVYRSQLRRQSNSYLGITRVPATIASGVETIGTGFEALTVNLGISSNTAGFALSSGVKNATLRRFDESFDRATWGNKIPDTILSTPVPYDDLENAMWDKTVIERDAHAFTGVEIRFPHLSYRGAIVIQDEYARATDATSPEGLYAFPLNELMFKIDPDAEFTPQDWKPGVDNLAFSQDVLLRCQLYAKEPRRFLRAFNYPVS